MNASGGIGRKAKLGKGQQIQARYKSKRQPGDREVLHAFPKNSLHFNVIRLDRNPRHPFDLRRGIQSSWYSAYWDSEYWAGQKLFEFFHTMLQKTRLVYLTQYMYGDI